VEVRVVVSAVIAVPAVVVVLSAVIQVTDPRAAFYEIASYRWPLIG